MPLLLAESAKLSNDMVQRGVIETILDESPMLRAMPFLEVEGNSYKFTQESTLGGASFYAVNGVWSEGTATFSSIYAIHFSPADGLVGLTNGGIEAIDVGPLETKDASRVRIRWYVGLAVLRDSAIARMNGVAAA